MVVGYNYSYSISIVSSIETRGYKPGNLHDSYSSFVAFGIQFNATSFRGRRDLQKSKIDYGSKKIQTAGKRISLCLILK
jgi:hypothetical protein